MALADFNELIAGFLEDAYALEEDDVLDEEGRALAENIAANLTGSVRPIRNKLEDATKDRKTRAELYDATQFEFMPQQQRANEASFKNHLQGIQRMVADVIGQQQKARMFMGIHPDKEPVVFKLSEHLAGNQPSRGFHPHDQTLSVPIPPGYEDLAEKAMSMLRMGQKQRDEIFAAMKAM